MTKTADIRLKAHPEGFQLDETGTQVFVNVPDAREIVMADVATGSTRSLSTQGAGSNFPMAIDGEGHRVLVVFRSPPNLMALASQDGHVAAKAETCGDADDVFVDRKRHRVYVSGGEGVVDVLESGEAATDGLRAYRQYRERARRSSCPSSTGCLWQRGRRPMSRRRSGYTGRPHEGGPSFGGVRYRGGSYLLVR